MTSSPYRPLSTYRNEHEANNRFKCETSRGNTGQNIYDWNSMPEIPALQEAEAKNLVFELAWTMKDSRITKSASKEHGLEFQLGGKDSPSLCTALVC